MSDETKDGTSDPQSDFDANRRNVLLSGVSMLALSAVGATLRTGAAGARGRHGSPSKGRQAKHPRHLGR